jgi:hypothetical protein
MTLLAAWIILDRTERVARRRALATAARLMLGGDADTLIALLRLAETEDRGLELADLAIEKLPTRTMRRLVACLLWQA